MAQLKQAAAVLDRAPEGDILLAGDMVRGVLLVLGTGVGWHAGDSCPCSHRRATLPAPALPPPFTIVAHPSLPLSATPIAIHSKELGAQ